jgi:hypothetical protein
MSSVIIAGNTSGTITLDAPNVAGTTTLTLPTTTDTLVGRTTTDTLTNKSLTNPTFDSAQLATVSGTAPLYMCRAWVNFNGTGTVAIRASGNVSSITDRGTGAYTINFTNNMPDANYSVCGTAWFDGTAACLTGVTGTPLTTAVPVNVDNNSGGGIDAPQCHYSIFR